MKRAWRERDAMRRGEKRSISKQADGRPCDALRARCSITSRARSVFLRDALFHGEPRFGAGRGRHTPRPIHASEIHAASCSRRLAVRSIADDVVEGKNTLKQAPCPPGPCPT